MYDIITQEPMPPAFAGVNSLYSIEYYRAAAARLHEGGLTLQWLPAHLVTSFQARSIAKTFREVFPNAVLWDNSGYGQAILVGQKNIPGVMLTPAEELGVRALASEPNIRQHLVLNGSQLERYSSSGAIITDDNQLLSYGYGLQSNRVPRSADEIAKEFALLP